MNPENTNGWVQDTAGRRRPHRHPGPPDQLNAQTPTTWATLAQVGASLDDGVRVVVVRGAGRSFSAGLDRQPVQRRARCGRRARRPRTAPDRRGRGPDRASYQAGFRWLRKPGIVSIAARAGARHRRRLPAGARLRPAHPHRRRAAAGCPRRRSGSSPDLTGTSTLVELVGYSRALEICLTGRAVKAAEAHAIGPGEPRRPGRGAGRRGRRPDRGAHRLPVNASRATAALVRSAVRNDFPTQDAAERAASGAAAAGARLSVPDGGP